MTHKDYFSMDDLLKSDKTEEEPKVIPPDKPPTKKTKRTKAKKKSKKTKQDGRVNNGGKGNVGRKKLFGNETVVLSVRVPEIHKAEIETEIKAFLEKYKSK